jgi:hypothetical protein
MKMNTNLHYSPISILQKILLSALVVLLALTVLARANPATRLPARDNGWYLYIGEQITHGKLPYKDAWENKPPAIFYTNAVGLWIGRGSRWGVWIIEFATLLIAIGVSFFLLKRLWETWPAVLGMTLWVYTFDKSLVGGNLTEEYPMPLHFISLLIFLELLKRPKQKVLSFILGLAFGISFLYRPNNAVTEAAVILTLLVVQGLRRDYRGIFFYIIWIGLGILSPLILTAGYFLSQGLLRELVEASLLYSLSYSDTPVTQLSPLQKGFSFFGIAAWIAALGYLIAIVRIIRNPKGQNGPVYLLLIIGAPLSVYFSDPARRMYEHYYMNWVPFIAMLCGLAVYSLISMIPSRSKSSSFWDTIGLVLLLFLTTIFFVSDGRAAQYQRAFEAIKGQSISKMDKTSRISTYVENHTEPDDLVLFWGTVPGENYMSNRASPTAILYYPLQVDSSIADELNDQFLQDLTSKRVVLIVDIDYPRALSLDPEKRRAQREAGLGWPYPPDNLEEVFEFIEKNYYVDAVIGGKTVYRLYGTK